MDILEEVKKVFDIEIEELQKVKDSLGKSIVDVINLIKDCSGKVIICGMGKPGHIAGKISATMSSLGITSYVLHPAEAMHGDLGTLSESDVIIMISNSGETTEICSILPNIRMIGTPIVAITSNEKSTLAQYSDYLVALPTMKEACSLKLAPTSSTTAALVLGDAISVVVSELKDFKEENFALFHPAGALGRKLTTKVRDIMLSGEDLPIVDVNSKMPQAIFEMCRVGSGAVIISDNKGRLRGLITDGDLKRYLKQEVKIYDIDVNEIMTKNPIIVHENVLAVDALKLMEKDKKTLSILPVLNDEDKVVGIVTNHDIIRLGIFI